MKFGIYVKLETPSLSITKNNINTAPIGVFDSGFGGLTVVKEISRLLPCEDIVFFGDSGRCPYGPRDAAEVLTFSLEICKWLEAQGSKMIIIACNTATAAALSVCQRRVSIPVIGVVMPGARAAVEATYSRKVGVIATTGTIASGAYLRAINALDSGVKVLSLATPELVDLVESELIEEYIERLDVRQATVYDSISPLIGSDIDTLVLGCTHFPLLKQEIEACFDETVTLVSSSEETAKDVLEILERRKERNNPNNKGSLRFVTSGEDVDLRNRIASRIMGYDIENVEFKSF